MDDMPQNGFTQEQLVIYKLGQIESQLAALLVELTNSRAQIAKDMIALDLKMHENREELFKHIDRLEKLENRVSTDRAWVLGAVAVVTAIITFGKDFFTQWLTSLSPH